MTEQTRPRTDDLQVDELEARMRLALAPPFAAEVVEFDDETTVGNLYLVCDVEGCLRMQQRQHRLCGTHNERWRKRDRQALAEFHAAPGPTPRPEQIVLGGLGPRQRVEVGLALQLAAARPAEHGRRVRPVDARQLIAVLEKHRDRSILVEDDLLSKELSRHAHGALTALRQSLEDFIRPPDPAAEFDRDVWRLRYMGVPAGVGQDGRLRFDAIPQPWLRQLVKRFMRWRIATGRSYPQLNRDITALQRLADALAAQAGPQATVEQFTRETIEAYLAMLVRLGLRESSRSYDISSVATFLRTVRQHDWQPDLAAGAGVFPGDHPARPSALPRALSEFVMAQIESPQALAKLAQPHRLIMQILIGTGLRITDAYRLEIDCLVRDAQGAPYLRYRNHKMKREAIVPIDEQLANAVDQQQRTVLAELPTATCLAPSRGSRDGSKPCSPSPAGVRISAWQEEIGLHDEQGRPFRFTAHQLRHTYGTRLINSDVPQEVVRRLLDHESPEMTARYARLSDKTIRRHWERARKVNIHGETITLEHGSPLSEAAWMKENLGRATMALPNGYCGLPLQQSCPHANACLTCPVFITTPDFLTEHLAHLHATNRLIGEAEAKGQSRVVEMNKQVAGNLENIITAIQDSDAIAAEGLDAR